MMQRFRVTKIIVDDVFYQAYFLIQRLHTLSEIGPITHCGFFRQLEKMHAKIHFLTKKIIFQLCCIERFTLSIDAIKFEKNCHVSPTEIFEKRISMIGTLPTFIITENFKI